MLRALQRIAWISSLWVVVYLGDWALCNLAFTPTTSYFNRIYLVVLVFAASGMLAGALLLAWLLRCFYGVDFDRALTWLSLLSFQFVLASVTWAQRLSAGFFAVWPDVVFILVGASVAGGLLWALSQRGDRAPSWASAAVWLLLVQSSVAVTAVLAATWAPWAQAALLALLAYGVPSAFLLSTLRIKALIPALATASAAFALTSHLLIRPAFVPKPADENPTAATRPNVLLIVLDTVRAESLGVYGYGRNTTPRLDAWSRRKDVLTFRNAFSDANWTLPSHSSLFTGLYVLRHGAKWAETAAPGALDYDALRDNYETLAERLSEAGYRTSAVVANNGAAAPETGLGQGFEIYDVRGPFEAYTPLVNLLTRDVRLVFEDFGARTLVPYRDARQITDTILAHHLSDDPASQKPFFLFVNYLDAHVPYNAPRAHRDRFRGISEELVAGASGLPRSMVHAGRVSNPTPAMEEHLRALYDAELHYLDEQLGRLFDWLERRPEIDERTLVIITSDHGESLAERGFAGHGSSLFNPQVAIPLLVKYPKGFLQGIHVDAARVAQLADVHATVLEAAGLSVPEPLDGIPLHRPREAAYIAGQFAVQDPNAREPMIVRHFELAVVSPPFKYYVLGSGEELLFDVREDPAETANLAAAAPDVVAVLRALAQEHRETTKPLFPEDEAERPAPNQQQLDRLRTLGYVQ